MPHLYRCPACGKLLARHNKKAFVVSWCESADKEAVCVHVCAISYKQATAIAKAQTHTTTNRGETMTRILTRAHLVIFSDGTTKSVNTYHTDRDAATSDYAQAYGDDGVIVHVTLEGV